MATQTLDTLKVNLIVKITHLDDEKSLRKIETAIDEVKSQPTKKQLEMLNKMAKPMREKLDIEELIKEQNWKPIDRHKFDQLVAELDIQEPIEQLIADIGK